MLVAVLLLQLEVGVLMVIAGVVVVHTGIRGVVLIGGVLRLGLNGRVGRLRLVRDGGVGGWVKGILGLWRDLVEFQGDLIELGNGRNRLDEAAEETCGRIDGLRRAEGVAVGEVAEGRIGMGIEHAVAALLLATRFGVGALFGDLHMEFNIKFTQK